MKREYTALIDSDWQDRTIKEYLREELNASSGIIKSLKARNGIYVNKAPAFVSRVLKKGEILTLILEEEEARSNIPVVYGHLDVIYEDEDILILNKPPNMPVHPSPGHERDTLSSLTAGYYAAKGQNVVCRFVNRLDCGTSGLIVMAKHALAHSVLASELHTNAFKRGYLAVTEGKISRGGIIDAPILAPETGINALSLWAGSPPELSSSRWNTARIIHCLNCCCILDGRTRFGRIWLRSGIRFWATGFTAGNFRAELSVRRCIRRILSLFIR